MWPSAIQNQQVSPNVIQSLISQIMGTGQTQDPFSLWQTPQYPSLGNTSDPFASLFGGGNQLSNLFGGGNPLDSLFGGGTNPLSSLMGGYCNPFGGYGDMTGQFGSMFDWIFNNFDIGTEVLGAGASSAWGDPHFDFINKETGKKETIDHKGIDGKTYRILATDKWQLDAEYAPYKDPKNPQVMGSLRLSAGRDQIVCHKGYVEINGKKVGPGTYTLADGSKVTVSKNKADEKGEKANQGLDVKITSRNGDSSMHLEYNSREGIEGGYYDVNRKGKLAQGTSGNVGILGFITSLAEKGWSKAKMLANFDTNKNGALDYKDKLPNFMVANDIGLIN